ncbi:hypothetical protein [Promicromonospora sp. NPDC023805]|uniref:hypothetical protein n=1 Tax=Promicromonospora sp. NPDC023805 TaxID=3154696 RepID=UPI0033DB432D
MEVQLVELTAEPGLSFLIYTADPGSPTEERLRLLASLAATYATITTTVTATRPTETGSPRSGPAP